MQYILHKFYDTNGNHKYIIQKAEYSSFSEIIIYYKIIEILHIEQEKRHQKVKNTTKIVLFMN